MVIAPDMKNSLQIEPLLSQALDEGVRIATINYPAILCPLPLDHLAHATGGPCYTVQQQCYDSAISYAPRYIKMANIMFSVTTEFGEGSLAGIPVEIHRRELSDDGRSNVTGSFVLDESLGELAEFSVYTHNSEKPLVRGISLVSPSQVPCSA
jgi:hypothetical protein